MIPRVMGEAFFVNGQGVHLWRTLTLRAMLKYSYILRCIISTQVLS